MSVLDKARGAGRGKEDAALIPTGSVSVKAVGEKGSWRLVFETPGGPVWVPISSMERAVKLSLRLAIIIARESK